ncbi:hypothetical protein FZC66_17835 [Priestia megaterium]|nr:hypothetical protein FZC66_17835 [Priestia megaterium]
MLVGNYLEQAEIKELVASFEGKLKFQNLIREMQYHEGFVFAENTIEMIQAMKFDVVKNEAVISAKVLYFKVSENVKIRYIIRHVNGDKETTNDFFIGELTRPSEEGDGFTITHFKSRNDTFVSSFESHLSEEAIALGAEGDKKSEEEFPFDEHYYPGMLLNDEVRAEKKWYQGCLPGGYIWCGDDCGGSASCTSSVKGVNGLDNCCKAHDCCYSKNKVSYPNCYCDQRLCDCSQAAPFAFNKAIVETAMCFVC